jgi:PAS domain S-box-containing protein/putative nucleotidyltransferase with HDIG domain
MPDAILLVDPAGTVTFANHQVQRRFGYAAGEIVGRPVEILLPAAHARVRATHRDGHLVPVDVVLTPQAVDGAPLTLCVIRDVTARYDLETKLSQAEQQYRHLVEHASEVFYRVAVDDDPFRGRVTYISPQIEAVTGYTVDAFLRDPNLWLGLLHPNDLPVVRAATEAILKSGTVGTREYRIRHRDGRHYTWVEDRVVPEHDARGVLVGYQGTARDVTERWWLHHRLRTMVTLGAALRNRRGRHDILAALLDALPPLFEANGVGFVSRETGDHSVVFELGRGVLEPWTGRVIPAADSVSARVIASGSPFVSNAARQDPRLAQPALPEDVYSYASLPVRTEQETVGALILTKATEFIRRELTVLEAVGELAAIALQRQDLHEQVVRKAIDLETAYESTIAGWARALDMRDRITQGHTQRVTELALRLAEVLHVPAERLPHVRRGAMLHDIGKMAIPDSILQKRGPLTPEERAIMQKHAEYAAELLGPIDFLQPAVEIPLYHHERWDGTGYPHGLKGEAIPLLARIFAVADVYDAITSERPYAAAEPHEAAMAFITGHSGSHFDPAVVVALQSLPPSRIALPPSRSALRRTRRRTSRPGPAGSTS